MDAKQALRALQSVDTDEDALTKADFDTSAGTPDQRSEVATYKTNRPLAIDQNRVFDLSLVAYETFTTDGTAGNTETFTLSNDLVESNAIGDSLVLYENGSEVQPDSVDYGADTFDYTDDGTANDLEAYYAAGEQARLEIQKVAPNGTPETLYTGDLGMVHRKDLAKNPLRFDLDLSPFQPILPKNFRLEVHVDAPYTVAFEQGDTTATNALFDIPTLGAPSEIEGLAGVVRSDMAER